MIIKNHLTAGGFFIRFAFLRRQQAETISWSEDRTLDCAFPLAYDDE